MRYPDFIEAPYAFPPFFQVHHHYPQKHIVNIDKAVKKEMDSVLPDSGILPGHRVAIGVGSRGIHQLPVILQAMSERIQTVGATPIIIPAMGSHGGATPEGQKEVLAQLGINEATCEAAVIPSLDTVQLGTLFDEVPIYYSKEALKATHTICINRIKPHTKFNAPIESGLMKMLCVGLGKHQGALAVHNYALKYGFFELLTAMGEAIIERSNYRFGIAVVENAYDKPIKIEAVPAARTMARESALLDIAKENFPRLPVKTADALIVGTLGKEISGAGMDPNVTGRSYDLKESDFSENFHATRVAVLNLSEKTAGNAIGFGNADFITEKVFQKLNYEKTIINALTSNSIRKAFTPIRMPSDEKAIQACFTTLGPVAPEAVRAILIKDTRHLSEFWITGALCGDLEKIGNEIFSTPVRLQFNTAGDLCDPRIC